MLTPKQLRLFSQAFSAILNHNYPQSGGNLAYTTCFSLEIIQELCNPSRFSVPGWEIYGITNYSEGQLITADKAVELREDKQGCILLLIDLTSAGAGLDGIYSAGREIKEADLFKKLISEAKKQLNYSLRELAEVAVKVATKIGNFNIITPWSEFNFYSQCTPENIGELIADLGLWCIAKIRNKDDLSNSARLVEKLLLVSGGVNNPAIRVASIILNNQEQEQQLEQFLRDNLGKNWRSIVLELKSYPQLWLNEINPSIFDTNNLQEIKLVAWSKNNKPYKWSGLKLGEDNRLVAIINPNPKTAKERTNIEVRWTTIPDDLPKGSLEYEVKVVSGEEVLASKNLAHSGPQIQKCKFTVEDFQDLEENDKFDANIIIRTLGIDQGNREIETEDFILEFGEPETTITSGIGVKVRSLVEAACKIKDQDIFLDYCDRPYPEDKKGLINFRGENIRARLFHPPLLKAVEQNWLQHKGSIGRWRIQIRTDGSYVGEPEFIPMAADFLETSLEQRLITASRLFCELAIKTEDCSGLIGFIYSGSHNRVDDYINSWIAALEIETTYLSLAHTLEIQSLSGKTLGLIVLPSHPLRVAWHSAYDILVQFCVYTHGGQISTLEKTLPYLDSSHFPAFLPGLNSGETFIFGDNLGFHTVAMVPSTDPEPKIAIAQMAKTLSRDTETITPSIGETTSSALGTEISKYTRLHPNYHNYKVQVIKGGDGMTVTKALGTTFNHFDHQFGYNLNLYSANKTTIVGKFLTDTTSKRRTGAGAISSEDRWLTQSYYPQGNQIPYPKLRWSKHHGDPQQPAHLSISFDSFDQLFGSQAAPF